MSESPISLRDETGIERFRGTQSPGGGSRPWTGPLKINCFAAQQVDDQVAGSVDGGTFTLIHDGDETTALDWDATPAEIVAALEALPSIGAGGVIGVTGTDVDSGYIVQFGGTTATEMLTADSSSLTGPDAPYNVGGLTWQSTLPLAVLAAGDVLEDVLYDPRTPFDAGGVIQFSDDPTSFDGGPPIWAPTAAGKYGPLAVDGSQTFTNFGTSAAADKASAQTLSLLQVAQWATDAAPSLPAYVPVPATGAVTIYVATIPPPSPTQGEVWLWAKTSTPTAP